MYNGTAKEDFRQNPFHLFDFERGTMRVPERIRGCVVFLQLRTGDEYHYVGTGFFAGVPVPDDPVKLSPMLLLHVMSLRVSIREKIPISIFG